MAYSQGYTWYVLDVHAMHRHWNSVHIEPWPPVLSGLFGHQTMGQMWFIYFSDREYLNMCFQCERANVV